MNKKGFAISGIVYPILLLFIMLILLILSNLTARLNIFSRERKEVENKLTPHIDTTLRTVSSDGDQEYLGHSLEKENVESITITDSKEVPSGAIESWGVATGSGEKVNKIMAYTMDSNSDGKLELYIGGDGGVQANAASDYLFSDFINVTSITGFENLHMDNVEGMSVLGMFQNCSKLESINLSSFDTKNVLDMSQMFSDCSSLTSLNLGNKFDTSSVTNMISMFSGCSSLDELNLSSFITKKVKDMSQMFYGCRNLTSLTLGNKFDTSSVTNMSGMFQDCIGLGELNLSSFDTKNVDSMSYMFYGCTGLTSLTLDGDFDTSNVQYMNSMFYGCINLTSLDLSKFDTKKVATMNQMFRDCSNLTTLTLGDDFDTPNVTNMGYTFYNCKKLTTTINITTTSENITYRHMFSGAATDSGAQITVNYTPANSSLVDSMIATKSASSNVVGIEVSS